MCEKAIAGKSPSDTAKVNGNFFKPLIQPKLTINQPNDIYEQEADAMADHVMRMPDPSAGNNSFFKPAITSVQRKCAHCEEEEKKIQRIEENGEITDARQKNFAQNETVTFFNPRIQTKLIVNQLTEAHGQKPGRSAKVERQVVSQQPASLIQRMCTDCEEEEQEHNVAPQVHRKCYSCTEEKIHRMTAVEEKQEELVQRKPSGTSVIDSRLESRLSNLGGGQPLPESARSFFEPRFGQSFSDVRVHTGADANQAAKSINARAYTLGNNIAFANGEYNISSTAGRSLIAHELTHTLQQSAGTKSVQRGSAGLFGGKGCMQASGTEWALVGTGVWKSLAQGNCTGTLEDADGMTCGGGFYRLDNGQTGNCSTPRHDDATFAPRRWTPTRAAANATSPTQEGSTSGDTPPGYVYDAAGSVTYPGCTTAQDATVETARTTGLARSTAAAAAITALKAGTGTAGQQAALAAHFTALSAAEFDTVKNRYDTISNRLRTPSLFACGSAPAQAYCGPPDNWCAGTPCPTTTGISYICPNGFGVNCAEPDLGSILLHEAGRAAGCCPPDVMPTDAGYPPAAPACLTNVYCYSGFARAV